MSENKECSGMRCPLTGCPVSQVLIVTILAAVAIFAYDWLVYGTLLQADYMATASIWRPEAEMQDMMAYCIGIHLLFGFGAAGLYCLFAKHSPCKGKCVKAGAKFGLMLGIILGAGHFFDYVALPVPLDLGIKWFVAGVIKGIWIGSFLAFVAQKMCKGDSGCATDTGCSK